MNREVGIGLLYDKAFRIDHLQQNYRPETFEHGCWELTVKGTSIHLHVIYRQPDGNLNSFLDKFTEYATRIADQSNIIFTGACNVYINDDQDQQAEIIRDTILALGLNQHVSFSTHRLDSILDIVLNELISNIQVCEVRPGPYVSDHLVVLFKLNIIKPNAKEKVTFRNLKDVSMGAVFSDLEFKVGNYKNIDSIVEDPDKKLDEPTKKVEPKRQKD